MNIIERITSLRSLMQERGIDGYLIYGTDPHLSEYVPEAWQSRKWISGFTGSYGKIVITHERAALWTDSRYFLQAETQLSGTGIEMIKDRQADTISVDQWLKQELNPGSIVALDGLTISTTDANNLEHKLGAKGISLKLNMDLVSLIWKNRPEFSQTPVIDFPVQFAGQSRPEKLSIIRNRLTGYGAEATLICQLDDLAWSFNLRGSEINYNPLFTAYGYIDQQQAILFIGDGKVSIALANVLEKDGVQVKNYESVFSFLEQLNLGSFYLDPDRINSLIYKSIEKRCNVIDGLSIPTLLKSIKNEVEIAGMRECHVRDGVAMVNFLYWFEQQFRKEKITELSVGEELRKFRSEQTNFMGESFSPIVSFGPHGAIVHYNATPESDIEIKPDGILLFDTGGQYLDGTTDITRTVATGKVTLKQQSDFTLVLKGNIQLAKSVFPENTRGYSLDILARKALWNNGLNYGHGTGHGVGHYLCVHEGPMSIRPEYNSEPIRAGQIITNEPGIYREGEYGIRIENVLVCKKDFQSNFGSFLSFDTITMCPIDRKLVDRQLLNDEEITWLNSYHTKVLSELGSRLNPEVMKWLKAQCEPI
ncbi:MAG TPA: aminopeptidase P family protein [Prolixibacteraceae bacterium]|nr:aminopeptidase P family protein [Prolixibacteraceae bacterium]